VCRQLRDTGWRVVLTARDEQGAERAPEDLGVEHHQLDVTSSRSVDTCAQWLRWTGDELHVLINNAGVHYDTGHRASRAQATIVEAALGVNVVGTWRTSAAMVPLMSPGARIVNVSSGLGSFAETDGAPGTPAYAVSKAALNMLTVKLAADLTEAGILVNAVCPGWVATDMGGTAGRPVADGAAGIVWAATLPPNGPTGGFFRDREPIPW
jgi:NAD(P)-dependent dehydrogenase (short-subunit alcohol dehydrogenase family)